MPKLSIIVPVYKAESYLEKSLESIQNQSFSDFEVMLVDDGSPDRCPEICDEWAKRDARFRVIHKENGGPQSAVRVGVQQAKGQYVGFVDSDDWIESDYFAKMIGCAEKYDADLVVTGWLTHDGQYVIRKKEYSEFEILNADQIRGILYDFWENGKKLPVENCRWNKLWDTKKLLEICNELNVNLKIGEDLEQILRYLHVCNRIILCPQHTGYFYRENQASLTHKFSEQRVVQLKELTVTLRSVAAEQKAAYRAKHKLESEMNFECMYDMFFSCQPWKLCIRYVKEILENGELLIPEHISGMFRIGFLQLKEERYLFGTIYLNFLFFVCRQITTLRQIACEKKNNRDIIGEKDV